MLLIWPKEQASWASTKRTDILILSGALDFFGKNRTQIMAVEELFLSRASKDKNVELMGQISTFSTLLK